jgi:survival-of-motor-neuron-related-splicing factor 30
MADKPLRKLQKGDDDVEPEENKEEEKGVQIEGEQQQPEKKKGKKYDPELVTLYQKLIEYKNHLYKLEALISVERAEDQRAELFKLKEELMQVIDAQSKAILEKQGTPEFILSTERLTTDDVDRVCKAYYEADGRWYNAQIQAVDIEGQTADLIFFGYKDVVTTNAVFVKVQPKPNPALFEAGTYCDAIYSRDGHYYACVVEKVSEAGYHVKFKQYNNHREVVPLIFLRESKNADNAKKKKKVFEDTTEFKVPEDLKILPNDTEQQREKKKKRLKALKASFKQSVIEKDSRQKQDKWLQFKQKAGEQKDGYYHAKKTESMFKSPDTIEGKVGVIGSGKGMTNFNPKMKLNSSDNSYLSRLF